MPDDAPDIQRNAKTRSRKRITHQFMNAVNAADNRFDRLYLPALMLLGVLYLGLQALERDWIEMAVVGLGVGLLFTLTLSPRLQARFLRRRINRRHATYLAFFCIYGGVWLNIERLLLQAEAVGKASGQFYLLSLLSAALIIMMVRALVMLTPWGYGFFATRIPLWEQALVALNEVIAAGLMAVFVGDKVLPRLIEPEVFTTRIDAPYTFGVTMLLLVYYLVIQLMWVQRMNDALSQNRVWVRLMRVYAPLALVVATLVIVRGFIERGEPRTADLLGDAGADLAILSLGAVVWLILLVLTFLVYTSGTGLRQRFLPDLLLDRLPKPIAQFLSSISDMDMVLILALLATAMPAYLFLLGDAGGVLATLSGQLAASGSVLIETTEQALALLFTMPFYALVAALLILYALVFSRRSLPAQDRDQLVQTLPVGFLIILILTLYLFAVPFSQVLTEGRLPQLPEDAGRILAFNVLIPLLLLYAHYFVLVRWPYGRGQTRWREVQAMRLLLEQTATDSEIERLNGELEALDLSWRSDPEPGQSTPLSANARFDTLFRYVQLNSLRDDLNMKRLQVITARQQLAELSEAPVSVTVARLPLRIVSLGIPLLIAIQLYQWAVLNNGLREIVNTPNITVDQFFRIILDQVNF